MYEFMVNGTDPFATANGGDAGGLKVAGSGTRGLFYEASYGKTFTVRLNVDAPTTINFYLIVNARYAGVTTDNTVTSILLDGKTDGVTRSATTAINPTTSVNSDYWDVENAVKVCYATIELHAGTNVISFVRTETSSNATNINIAGIAVESVLPVKLASDKLEYTFFADDTHERDLFHTGNGGSVSAGNYSSSYAWQQTYGATIKFKIYAEKATTASIYLTISGAKGDTSVATAFTSLIHTVGNATNNVALIDTAMSKTSNWAIANANTVLIAEVELQAGVNEFTLVRNSDTNSGVGTNINIWGVKFTATEEITAVKS